jgi:hypothetical protein
MTFGFRQPYDILDDVCNSKRMLQYIRFPHPLIDRMRKTPDPKRYVPNQDPCIDDHVTAYLNTAAVQQALHVRPVTWQECGGPNYDFYTGSILPYYQPLIQKSSYRMLVYSGDEDTVINFLSTETWILQLKRNVVQAWKPWYYQRTTTSGNQVGGWGIKFDRIAYKTVKGAGHMVRNHCSIDCPTVLNGSDTRFFHFQVPWWQPAPALQMFTDFLNNK